jgi:hypothetical protein
MVRAGWFAPPIAQKYGLRVARQSSKSPAPFVTSAAMAWSKNVVQETLPTFAPAYGRSDKGVWGAGNGKMYTNVIRLIFYHGVHLPGQVDVNCAARVKTNNPRYKGLYFNFPAGPNSPGYNSYVSEFYLAPGKGIIQESLLYIEKGGGYFKYAPNDCTAGVLFSEDQSDKNPNIWYVDEG